MEIALRNTLFNSQEVNLPISLKYEEREKLSQYLWAESRKIEMPANVSPFDRAVHILEYLRSHQEDVIEDEEYGHTVYYVYRKRATVKTMARFRVIDVNTSRPWMIGEEYGAECIMYLRPGANNQFIRYRNNYGYRLVDKDGNILDSRDGFDALQHVEIYLQSNGIQATKASGIRLEYTHKEEVYPVDTL